MLRLPIILVAVLSFTVLGCSREAGYRFETKPRAVLAERGIAHSARPMLAFDTGGTLAMLSVNGDEGTPRLYFTASHDSGDNWMPLRQISSADARVSSFGENGPTLVRRAGLTYVLWHQTSLAGSDIMFARGGHMGGFDPPVRVTDKKTPSFNGFSNMTVAPNGDIYAVWLDGREKAVNGDTFGVYFAKSSDGGKTFLPNRRIALSACPCCRPSVTVAQDGGIFVAWRQVYEGNVRDIVVAKSTDFGESFSEPVRVHTDNWVLPACPDVGPSMIAVGTNLYIAWYTEGSGSPSVSVAVSRDYGRTFSAPVNAAANLYDANHPYLALSEAGEVVLTFQARSRPKNDAGDWNPVQAFVASITSEGEVRHLRAVPAGANNVSNPVAAVGRAGQLFVAWTTQHQGASQVELIRGRRGGKGALEPTTAAVVASATGQPVTGELQEKSFLQECHDMLFGEEK